jgi:porin
MSSSRCWHLAIVCALQLGWIGARADEAGDSKGADTGIPSPSIATSLPAGLKDPGGVRQALAARGITYKLNYTGEVLSNVSGGLKRGTIYEGLDELVLDVDLAKSTTWKGLSLHANVFQIHGRQLTPGYIGSLDLVSSIEALPTTRLSEAWVQQKLLDDRLTIRLGQLAADTEFIRSSTAGLFVNSTFGFPTIDAIDLPSGGPAYPLATPGALIKVEPTVSLALLAAIFDGDPAGPGPGDPQARNRYGLDFRLKDPPFFIGEAQYKYGNEKSAVGLPGTVKLGGWYHAERFDNVRFGTDGVSLAFGNGIPQRMPGNWGIYGVLDQQLWRLPGPDADKGVSAFVRLSGSPADRNEISFYADGGLSFNGLVPGRPDDAFGVAVSYSRVSPSLGALDRDRVLAGTGTLIQDYEALIEVTYQAQIVPGWTLQPDFEYVWHPGGHVPISSAPNAPAIPDATIVGLRTTLNY